MAEIEYREFEGALDEETMVALAAVAREVDSPEGAPPVDLYCMKFRASTDGRPWVHLCMAYDDGRPVGYKLGASDDPRSFESINGGILADYRRRGIASELAQRQERWGRDHKFGFITTLTAHDNAPMLILNLRRGFTIAGTFRKRGAHLVVALEKCLDAENPPQEPR